MRSLTYHHISSGGVPMTPAGAKRFAYFAILDGHSKDAVLSYLKDHGFVYTGDQ